jgi:uncharacterized protein (DUF1330 family)
MTNPTDPKPGRGYIYVEMTIEDPTRFKDYTALSAPAVHAAGGYNSASYWAARQKREGVADFKMLLLEGASPS